GGLLLRPETDKRLKAHADAVAEGPQRPGEEGDAFVEVPDAARQVVNQFRALSVCSSKVKRNCTPERVKRVGLAERRRRTTVSPLSWSRTVNSKPPSRRTTKMSIPSCCSWPSQPRSASSIRDVPPAGPSASRLWPAASAAQLNEATLSTESQRTGCTGRRAEAPKAATPERAMPRMLRRKKVVMMRNMGLPGAFPEKGRDAVKLPPGPSGFPKLTAGGRAVRFSASV